MVDSPPEPQTLTSDYDTGNKYRRNDSKGTRQNRQVTILARRKTQQQPHQRAQNHSRKEVQRHSFSNSGFSHNQTQLFARLGSDYRS